MDAFQVAILEVVKDMLGTNSVNSVPAWDGNNWTPTTLTAAMVTNTADKSQSSAQTFLGPIGYTSGAGVGGAVTQATSLTTAVTLNKICGQITTFTSALAGGLVTSFTVNNTLVVSTDTIEVQWRNVVTPGIPIWVSNINGGVSFQITYWNQGSLTASAANVIEFAVVRAVNS